MRATRGDAIHRGLGHGQSPSREFLYVDDAAEGIVLAADRYDGAEPVNLGVGREITIRELVELIAELSGFTRRAALGRDEAGRPATAAWTRAGRARAFGFDAKTSFEDGLRRTIDWYLANRS